MTQMQMCIRDRKYTEQAKKEWGETPEYKEFEEKPAHKTEKEVKDMSSQLMDMSLIHI